MNETKYVHKTPRELGYRMPAEWAKHEAIWLAWPYDPTTFISGVEKVECTFVQIIKAIHEHEYVNLFVKDEDMYQKVSSLLGQSRIDLSKVRFLQFEYADVWFRDYGPIFLLNQKHEIAMVHWIFNSWGEKYTELLKDADIPIIINRNMLLKCFEPGIVLEGGAVDVNGKGTLLTTEQCLLNKNRNPQLKKEDIEKFLQDYLGVSNIIWLKNGIAGDDTDGHIDDVARFVNPTTVVCAYEEGEDENSEVLRKNYELLCQSTDQDGKKLDVIKLPMPGNIQFNGERLPASYTNFYIGNKTVLVPTFKSKKDKDVLNTIQKLFPKRKVVGINCVDLLCGFGAIHCVTQQQPALPED